MIATSRHSTSSYKNYNGVSDSNRIFEIFSMPDVLAVAAGGTELRKVLVEEEF